MNIPHKFTFFNGNNNLLKLTNINGDYYCTLPNVEANPIHSAVYDRMNVEHKLHTGKWKIVADLSVAEKEPEMKFPFTFKCKGWEHVTYTALHQLGGDVLYTWEDNTLGAEHISINEAKKAIKDNFWVVQSVGEQEPKEEIVEPVPEYGIHIDEKGNAQGHGLTMEKHTVGNISKLTISVGYEGIDEATAKMERLAQATENVTMAFDSLQSVLDDMGLSFGSKLTYEVTGGDDPFCCNN